MIPILAYKRLLTSVHEHYTVDAQVNMLLEDILDSKYIGIKKKSADIFKYMQHNFFSILFLSIYRAINIPKERRIFYGIINHCLRGIVTGTDNLLDNEYKEMLPLRFPSGADRFRSVMHILLFDRFMFKAVEMAADKGIILRENIDVLHREIFRAIVPIGAEEAEEEGGISSIISPADILSSIHMYKGGKLLCLAFVAPRIIEKEFSSLVETAEKGVYSIGMALQVIDDITDFYDDIKNRKHNYLVSSIYFDGNPAEKESIRKLLNGKKIDKVPVRQVYRNTVSRVMEQTIGEALVGFELLKQSGYWFNRRTALSLIYHIFHLRGVKNLLDLLPDYDDIKLSLGGCHGESTSHTGQASK